MGVWLLSVVAAGLAALGLSLGPSLGLGFGIQALPAHDRPIRAGVPQEAAAQARIAFEVLVREHLRSHGAFTGTLRAGDLRDAGTSSPSLAQGAFPAEWTATVAAGGAVAYCTHVPDRMRPALLQKGYSLESLTCGT